ncbi:MAG: cytochrome d ubiquinol oxidase subunit II [Archangium sp.]
MPELWFWLVAFMFIAWATLDGFDFGVGILHRFIAKTDAERRQVIGSIGPVWDGNEVWLIAAGGSTLLAFPKLMASGFSGLYLPVIFAVWAIMVRGASIELRSHLGSPLWRSFFDVTFFASSLLVPILFGAALGNVLRGVPLTPDGWFELPLFASWNPFGELGVLDWFTVLCGVFVTVALTAHGANWLVLKTDGAVQQKAVALQPILFVATAVLWCASGVSTFIVAPPSINVPFIAGLVSSVGGAAFAVLQRPRAFFGSSAFVVGNLVTALGGMFPVVLRSRPTPELSLTATSAASHGAGIDGALVWWIPGVLIAAAYFWWVMRHFRGRVSADDHSAS